MKTYCTSNKTNVIAGGSESMSLGAHPAINDDAHVPISSVTFPVYNLPSSCNPTQKLRSAQTSSGLAHAEDIILLSNNYRDMQHLLEAVKHNAVAAGKRINVSNAKLISAFIPAEVNKFENLDSMFIVNGQSTG